MRLTGAINTNLDAINTIPRPIPKVVQDAVIFGKTPNRRDRKVYNDYMREYMRRRRG